MEECVWLTWEIQRRNRTLSSKLNANLYEITAHGSRWRRYPLLITRTLKILFKTKPALIFAQNPSLLLSAIVVLYGKFSRSTIIVDSHNAGIFPIEGKSAFLNRLARIINSHFDKVIVSNHALKKFIDKNEVDIFAIPDPIPDITKHSAYPIKRDKYNLVFVCSWAEDEPYKEILTLANNLSDIVNIYLTGNSHNKEKVILESLPENIILTGFLSDSEYEDLIIACDAIMVLTTRDDCLVCGAYEGVAVEKPMILSDTKALTEYFNKGCIYTDNTEADIEKCIKELIKNHESLTLDVKALKTELEQKTDICLTELNRLLPQTSNTH